MSLRPRRPPPATSFAVLALSLVLLSACGGSEGSLFVDVRTDYVQVSEFDAIEIQVVDRTVRHEAEALSDYSAGVRVAELEGLPRGSTVVVARLLLGDTRVADASMSVDLADRTAITFDILRACAGGCVDGGAPLDAGGVADASSERDGSVGTDGGTPACMHAQAVQGDTVIVDTACNGSISYGAQPFLNLSVGNAHGLFRFDLDEQAGSALAASEVTAARLVLVRATDCAGAPCPAIAGTLRVRPMRRDWVEGNGTPYSGADWCRRSSGMSGASWGAEGASQTGVDVGPEAGVTMYGTTEPEITIDLDPAVLAADWVARDAYPQISLQTTSMFGTLVIGTREGSTAARLELDVCP